MPTVTSSRGQTSRPPAAVEDGAAKALQQLIEDVDRMRDEAGEGVRRQLDTAVQRMRDVAGELRERADERSTDVQNAVVRVADDAWQQIGVLAVRAQHDVDALSEISNEIRKRKAQLRAAEKRAGAGKDT